uniref:RNA-directed DNA polymerase from mobile element jockey n=1 Tax=Sipha flava TaxID=143950 RepID=A0A2S2Q460_9HEMI
MKKYPSLTPVPKNWYLFKLTLETKIDLSTSLKSISEIDNAVESFTKIIQNSATASSPESKISNSKKKNLLPHIQQLLSKKRQARNRWQSTSMLSDKKALNQSTNSLRNTLKIYNSDKYQSYVKSLSNNKNSI